MTFQNKQQERIYELAKQVIRYFDDADYREQKERSATNATDGTITWFEATCTELWIETERMRVNR